MVSTSALGEMLNALLERPRQYLKTDKTGPLERLCDELMHEDGEIERLLIASQILNRFEELDPQAQASFFSHLNDVLDVDPEEISSTATAYAKSGDPQDYRQLARATEPGRYELLRRLNQPPGATTQLVRMRAALLKMKKSNPDLARTDTDFTLMLRAWFNRGFLVLRQITWESPASILEKIIEYEAVHEIETWDDLRRRLHPSDRRCFAFFHPAMPDEPLIFVEVALSKGIPSSIQDVLTDRREILEEETADTAVFYSISNCQAGLAGISFGNSLIKQVVRDLSLELPNIKNFVTLSPIPGLRRWAAERGLEVDVTSPPVIRKLAATYLLNEKGKKNLPLDPVARFHLGNGAQVFAIHADADSSENGDAQSYGAMVNYLYEPDKIADNLQRFSTGEKLAASNSVNTLARRGTQMLRTAD